MLLNVLPNWCNKRVMVLLLHHQGDDCPTFSAAVSIYNHWTTSHALMHSNSNTMRLSHEFACRILRENLTIPIHIIITFITQAVLISIPLRRIFNCFAVVTGVTMGVAITVLLVHIRNKPTIVLGRDIWDLVIPVLLIPVHRCLRAYLLTSTLKMPSLSASSSQASPAPSRSESSWPEFGTKTQLSWNQQPQHCFSC